jgi:leucyl aminopeptidase
MLISLLLLSITYAGEPVIAPLHLLEKLKVKIVDSDSQLGVGMANLTEAQRDKLSQWSHEAGKCGGYEWISPKEKNPLAQLRLLRTKQVPLAKSIQKKESIELALKELKEDNLRTQVEWLSAFPTRNSRQADPNRHVVELGTKLRELLSSYPGMWTVDLLSHTRTPQKSLRVRLTGKTYPREVIVLGGHLDSINQSWSNTAAPGADDNASGSANLIETLRVFVQQGIPERTVEFFWYAAEEQGLVGSSEIATKYKSENVDVVAVLQLDMTSFPGSGEFVIGNVTDFTSLWLRQLLNELNDAYIQVRMIDDKCGYACSDHASWYRQGYSTLLPFEATTATMNRKIHTDKDLPDSTISFRHSLVFSKIALAYTMELANSRERGSTL